MRIELNREKIMNKGVTLLDIKSKFCNFWEKRFSNIKGMKKDDRMILDKVIHCAVLSNSDNDVTPILHIRFDMIDFDFKTIVTFTDTFVDKFKLKGIPDINDIINAEKSNIITFNNKDQKQEMDKEYIIYTKGINMEDIRYINNIDLNRTVCNDVVKTYEIFGIEAVRALLLKELKLVFQASTPNFQHLSVLIDIMTNSGGLISIDRHGLTKTDSNPLSRASFERTVDQFITAAIFGEKDNMNSVSSRIMGGLVIKGGTGLCNIKMDTEMLEKSEFIEDLEQKYDKSYTDISQDPMIKDIIDRDEEDDGVFMPF
jgi:DNA-directed RNA polymerase II subunit RPB1